MDVVGNHQPPEVNYLPCLENDDSPCRKKVRMLLCRVNRHAQKGFKGSLGVAGKRNSSGRGPDRQRGSRLRPAASGRPRGLSAGNRSAQGACSLQFEALEPPKLTDLYPATKDVNLRSVRQHDGGRVEPRGSRGSKGVCRFANHFSCLSEGPG